MFKKEVHEMIKLITTVPDLKLREKLVLALNKILYAVVKKINENPAT